MAERIYAQISRIMFFFTHHPFEAVFLALFAVMVFRFCVVIGGILFFPWQVVGDAQAFGTWP